MIIGSHGGISCGRDRPGGWTVAQALTTQDAGHPRATARAPDGDVCSGIASAASDPRAFLIWQRSPPHGSSIPRRSPCSTWRRRHVPFTVDQLQAAHARWSTDWLAWERLHDGEHKLKAAMARRWWRPSGASGQPTVITIG